MSTSLEDSNVPEGFHPEMLNPLFDLRQHLTPTVFACYFHHQQHSWARLIASGKIEVNGVFIMTEVQGFHPDMMNPLFNLRDHMTPTMYACYLHHQRHAVAWLVEQGMIKIAAGECIRVNERGFIVAGEQ